MRNDFDYHYAALLHSDNSVYFKLLAAIVDQARKDVRSIKNRHQESLEEISEYFKDAGDFESIAPVKGPYVLRKLLAGC